MPILRPYIKRLLMNSMLTLIKKYWLQITISILTLITVLSLYPLNNLPSVPGSDKTHHFIAYAGLMLPTALRRPKHWLFIGFFFLCWSGVIELIQPYVNRYGEWLDLAANMSGILIGICIAFILNKAFSSAK